MPTARQAAIWGGGQLAPYVDLNFATDSYKAGAFSSSSLIALSGFTFTGASLRTMFDSTGAMTYGPNNLGLQSQTFDNASWSKSGATITADTVTAPDGTLTADKLVEDSGTSQHRVFNNAGITVSTTETVVYSIYAKAAGRNFLFLADNNGTGAYFNLTTGVVSNLGSGVTAVNASDAGNGWWRCCIARVPSTSAGRLAAGASTAAGTNSYTGDGTSGLYLWGAQLEAVTYRTTPAAYMPTTSAAYYGPRLVYDPVTLASLGILVEEARTNVILQSNTFSTTWANGNITLTAGSITGPDGTASGWKFQNTATATTSFYQSATLTGTTATASVYVKVGTSTTNAFILRNVTTATDLISGTLTWATPSISGSGWSITAVGNGWYRVVGTASTGITSGDTLRFYVGHAGSSATAGEYFHGFNAQLEAGAGASSAIVTTTAAVTRAADVPLLTGLAPASALTLVTTGRGVVGFANNASVAAISDGTTSNRLLNYTASATSLRAFAVVGGSGSVVTAGTTTDGASFSQATSFDGVNRVATSGNGSSVGTGTVALTPSALTQLNIGTTAGSSSEQRNGTISRIRVYKSALSDAQLQALTA